MDDAYTYEIGRHVSIRPGPGGHDGSAQLLQDAGDKLALPALWQKRMWDYNLV